MELKALSHLQCQNGSEDNYVKLPTISLPSESWEPGLSLIIGREEASSITQGRR